MLVADPLGLSEKEMRVAMTLTGAEPIAGIGLPPQAWDA